MKPKKLSSFCPAAIIAVLLALLLTACSSEQPVSQRQSFAGADAAKAVNYHIRGNRKSRIYHWEGCPNYSDIKENHIAEFATVAEAKKAGYRAAKNCSDAAPGGDE